MTTQLGNIPGRNLESEFEIVGSCTGLVCAVFDSENHTIVWNLATRDSKELPVPNGKLLDVVMIYGLMITNSKEFHLCLY